MISSARIASVATLALALLPVSALATAAYAQAPAHVYVGDVDPAKAADLARFRARVDVAADSFCRDQRPLALIVACRALVQDEALDALKAAKKPGSVPARSGLGF